MPKRRILFGAGVAMVVMCLSFFLLYTHVLKPPDVVHAEFEDSENYTPAEYAEETPDETDMEYDYDAYEEYSIEDVYDAEDVDDVDVIHDIDDVDDLYDVSDTEDIDYVEDIAVIYDGDSLYSIDDAELYEYYEHYEDEQEHAGHTTPAWESTSTPYLVRVHIPVGMPASRIATRLRDAGVVEDRDDFLRFLIENGYTRRMDSGTFRLVVGAPYEELARQLVRGRR